MSMSASAVRSNPNQLQETATPQHAESPATRREGSLSLSFVCTRSELLEVQRLRERASAAEFAVRHAGPITGVQADVLDAFCDHLLVRDALDGHAVGTCRMLRPELAAALGGYEAERRFDLSRLHALRPRLVEMSHACIAPDRQSGAVLRLLWAGIARFMLESGYAYLIGTTRIGTGDGGHHAASVFWALYPRFATAGTYATHPLDVFALDQTVPYLDPNIPALTRGYLRSGARICGMPAWDQQLRAAELLMLLDMKDLPLRVARHAGPGDRLHASRTLPIAA